MDFMYLNSFYWQSAYVMPMDMWAYDHPAQRIERAATIKRSQSV